MSKQHCSNPQIGELISNTLDKIRARDGITESQLAERLKTTRWMLRRWRDGKVPASTAALLPLVVDLLSSKNDKQPLDLPQR